jgi:hypothetical protein
MADKTAEKKAWIKAGLKAENSVDETAEMMGAEKVVKMVNELAALKAASWV